MNYKEIGSQKEINKIFLKACKTDDIELVKYLLTNEELFVKAQLNISKQTGFVNEKKDGFVPLIFAAQHNSKKVLTYFLEEIKWFSTLTHEGKMEVLGKTSYTNDVETFNYVFKKFEETTKINNYQKPFVMDKLLESVVDKNSINIFDYLMKLSKEYKEHINTKNDQSFKRAAKTSPVMLEHMLKHEVYKDLFTEVYLNAFEETKKNPVSSLILFKYGIDKKWVDIWLTKYAQSYIRDKITDNVFKTYHDSLIKYIHEEQIKLSYPERLFDLANENIRNYFYTEDEYYKNKNNQKEAPILEYVIKNNLLNKETKETIVFEIVKHDYKNLLTIISKYPQYGEGINLNKAFEEIIHKGTIGKEKYEKIIQILNLDVDKKLIVWADDFALFKEMEIIKSYGQNYDNNVKQVFVDYYFWTDEKLRNIYKDNPEMLKIVELKELNMKLLNESEKLEIKTSKKNKI